MLVDGAVAAGEAGACADAGCAIGTQPAGAACTFTPDPARAYDDCADGLACVAGTCRPTCSTQAPCATGTCGYVPGYPPEIMLCQ